MVAKTERNIDDCILKVNNAAIENNIMWCIQLGKMSEECKEITSKATHDIKFEDYKKQNTQMSEDQLKESWSQKRYECFCRLPQGYVDANKKMVKDGEDKCFKRYK